jgi:ATP-dependent Clp protease ATP-binding subunit ClpA
VNTHFLTWHYNEGVTLFIRKWKTSLASITHYFSMSLLPGSLFSSWKRMSDTKDVGWNPGKYFEKVSFNLISRGVGAVARITLLFAGSVVYLFMVVAGLIGLVFWFMFPFIGMPFYSRYLKHPKRFVNRIRQEMIANPDKAIEIVFGNDAGRFVLDHVGLTIEELLEHATHSDHREHSDYSVNSFTELVNHFIKEDYWHEDFFRRKSLSPDDLLTAAKWWDRQNIALAEAEEEVHFGRPGIGLELLFGYTPVLTQYSIDLGAPQSFSHRLIGREDIVNRMERALTAGTSVIVKGTPGVGKKTVVLEFAHRAALGYLGSAMAYRRVLELDYNALFKDIRDLNEKKLKLASVLSEAASAGNIILVIKDLHKLTNSMVEGLDLTDIFEKYLEKKDLKVIALTTGADYERHIASNLRLKKFFDVIDILPPTKQEAMDILLEAANKIERAKGKVTLIPALRAIIDGSDRYVTETPFPEKALELLDAVVTYKAQKGENVITAADVNVILSEKTGISLTGLTDQGRHQLAHLEDLIHENLVNQDAAVNLIAMSLRSRSTGFRDENRPIGTFMFLGPTGVGKTQTAKVLANVYFGDEKQIVRFDMAEYATSEGVTRLIGSQERNQPGELTTAIRNHPASLLLLDEIEKAPHQIFNLLLTLLDEGYITDAFGRKIDCRHLFIIATSNAGAEFIREQVAAGAASEDLQKQVLEYVQKEKMFSPELLNRFDGVVVFEPLTHENLVKVALLQLQDMIENLARKNIYLKVSEDVATKIAYEGYDPAFGARPMRRIIDLHIGDVIGKSVLSGEVGPGDTITLVPGEQKGQYFVEKLG